MVNDSVVFVLVRASGWTRMKFGYYGSLDPDLVRFMFDPVYFSLIRVNSASRISQTRVNSVNNSQLWSKQSIAGQSYSTRFDETTRRIGKI
ncbi:hypothetical protein Hanom_Chr00s094395g01800521 [Helianthus anomalus]